MAMSPDGKVSFKCDLCIRRTAQGKEPACVASCPTGALYVTGDDEGANKEKRQAAVERLVAAQDAGAEEAQALGR
jgi:formate dehydrogenase iron-sulfur subunit